MVLVLQSYTCSATCQKAASVINGTQSVLTLMCEREHTAPHVQKTTYYAHKYVNVCHFTHAHDTVGFQ